MDQREVMTMKMKKRNGFYVQRSGYTGNRAPRRNCQCGGDDMASAIDKMLAGGESGLDPAMQALLERKVEAEIARQTGEDAPTIHTVEAGDGMAPRGALKDANARRDANAERTVAGPLRPRGVLS